MRSRGIRLAAVAMLAAAFVLGGVYYAFAEKTIALSTGTIELSLAPGSSASDKIAVANNGDEPFKAMVYTADVTYDEKGTPAYEKPDAATGDFLSSPASWMTLRMPTNTQVIANTPYIELQPGEEMIVDFDLVVPQGAEPGDHSAIVFFEMFDTEPTTGATSKISGRLGCRVILRVAGEVVERVNVAPFSARGFVIGDAVPYSFTVSNEGNVDKRYSPSLVVLDSSEAERQRTLLEEEATVYAGNSRQHSGSLQLERPLFGRYVLRAEVTYAREAGEQVGSTIPEIVQKDRAFWAFPLWFVIVAILVVALPVLWLIWRSTSKRAARW
jgi:dihydroorotate dehydrogenase (fumarate)